MTKKLTTPLIRNPATCGPQVIKSVDYTFIAYHHPNFQIPKYNMWEIMSTIDNTLTNLIVGINLYETACKTEDNVLVRDASVPQFFSLNLSNSQISTGEVPL